ncbi:MAG TPA: preprotein translocase subunit SecE [Chthoniobacterales bacterium]|nr:preprotein translocase subunit SecE [Chthoniobacterales bacterium]
MITKTRNFFNEVKVELQKASWPWDPKEKGFRRYKELWDSTLVVVISMLLLGGYVALFDFVLVNVIHFFTKLH